MSFISDFFRGRTLVDFSRPVTTPSMGTANDDEWKQLMKTVIQILKYVYWIVGGGGLVALCYVLYNGNPPRCVAAVLIFMAGVLALYYYYIKWFFVGEPSSWPTGQSLCPDYLTPVSPGFTRNFDGSMKPNPSGTFACVDFVGVSTNGALRKSNPSTVSKALSDPAYHVTISPKMTSKDIKDMLKARGLTWIAMFTDDV